MQTDHLTPDEREAVWALIAMLACSGGGLQCLEVLVEALRRERDR